MLFVIVFLKMYITNIDIVDCFGNGMIGFVQR